MAEKPIFEKHEVQGAGGYLYAPHSGDVESRMAIREGEIIVDFSNRGTIAGVEYLVDVKRGSMHDFVLRGLLSWGEYEAGVYTEVEAIRLKRLNIPERVNQLDLIPQIPRSPQNN